MSQTDPIADMLTSLRNANMVFKESVAFPYSKIKEELVRILVDEGYLTSYGVKTNDKNLLKTIEVKMKYDQKRQKVIAGIKRVSKPGLRVYARSDEIPKVLGGLGVAVLSTSKGLMTDIQARKQRIGGEVICFVW